MTETENRNPQHLQWDRRTFLKACGVLTLGMAAGGTLQATTGLFKFNRRLYHVADNRIQMGTFVSMTLFDASAQRAEEAMGQAYAEIDRLSAILSRHDSDSPLFHLNKTGSLDHPPPEMMNLVQESLRYHRLSHGLFDITVLPLVDLFQSTKGQLVGDELESVLTRVDARNIHWDISGIRFAKPGMGITLDGIAKGYIVDRAAAVLRRYGVEHFLINAGGDIITQGKKEGAHAWTVAVEDPAKKGHYPAIFAMNDGAVATSGNYEIYYDQEKLFHHIVNPVSGKSPQLNASVSVRARSVMEADALSTTVFVMSPEQGIHFINQMPSCEGLVISAEGETLKSQGWV
ncbi:MAG: FAD:protein FMN transferase [Gemmatimonadetes bacterium]|nr:MAG: FAD:protein FMN transferase [Gemmatimonadota bacterium]